MYATQALVWVLRTNPGWLWYGKQLLVRHDFSIIRWRGWCMARFGAASVLLTSSSVIPNLLESQWRFSAHSSSCSEIQDVCCITPNISRDSDHSSACNLAAVSTRNGLQTQDHSTALVNTWNVSNSLFSTFEFLELESLQLMAQSLPHHSH